MSVWDSIPICLQLTTSNHVSIEPLPHLIKGSNFWEFTVHENTKAIEILPEDSEDKIRIWKEPKPFLVQSVVISSMIFCSLWICWLVTLVFCFKFVLTCSRVMRQLSSTLWIMSPSDGFITSLIDMTILAAFLIFLPTHLLVLLFSSPSPSLSLLLCPSTLWVVRSIDYFREAFLADKTRS